MDNKIIGNIVGLPSPRSDWDQTDENKADFIKNKPEGILTNADLPRIAKYVIDSIPDGDEVSY